MPLPARLPIDPSTVQFFWERVRRKPNAEPDDCWQWRGGLHRDGYGVFTVRSKRYLAHRLAWELERGAIPKDKMVVHTPACKNRGCVRPAHLELVNKNRAKRHSYPLEHESIFDIPPQAGADKAHGGWEAADEALVERVLRETTVTPQLVGQLTRAILQMADRIKALEAAHDLIGAANDRAHAQHLELLRAIRADVVSSLRPRPLPSPSVDDAVEADFREVEYTVRALVGPIEHADRLARIYGLAVAAAEGQREGARQLFNSWLHLFRTHLADGSAVASADDLHRIACRDLGISVLPLG